VDANGEGHKAPQNSPLVGFDFVTKCGLRLVAASMKYGTHVLDTFFRKAELRKWHAKHITECLDSFFDWRA